MEASSADKDELVPALSTGPAPSESQPGATPNSAEKKDEPVLELATTGAAVLDSAEEKDEPVLEPATTGTPTTNGPKMENTSDLLNLNATQAQDKIKY